MSAEPSKALGGVPMGHGFWFCWAITAGGFGGGLPPGGGSAAGGGAGFGPSVCDDEVPEGPGVSGGGAGAHCFPLDMGGVGT